MMNKKNLLHIIAVASLGVFIVLGLASGTMESGTYSDLNAQSGTQRRLYSAQDYYKRARENEEKGNYQLAIEDYTEAIRLSPPNPAPLYNGRAWTYAFHMKTNYDLALADINQALRLQPNDAYYLDTRGWVYLGMGDYDRAIDDFNAALQIDRNLQSSKDGLKKIRDAQAEEVIDWSQFE